MTHMIFSSPVLLFIFLPVTLVPYALTALTHKTRVENAVLLFCSICFYTHDGVSYLGLLFPSILANRICGPKLSSMEHGRCRVTVSVLGLVYNVGILIIFKCLDPFGDTAAWTAGRMMGQPMASVIPATALPVGISLFMFQIMSYLIDVYKETVLCQHSLPDLAPYVILFPQLIAGPIVRCSGVEQETGSRSVRLSDVHEDVFRFIVGLTKKILPANAVDKATDLAFTLEPRISVIYARAGIIYYGLQVHLNPWACPGVATGPGRIFGFYFLENFNNPYISKDISELQRRWYISLSTWFRGYVYIPLGGSQEGLFKNCRNFLIVFTPTDIWHEASWNLLLQGFYFILFLILGKLWLRKILERLPSLLRHVYVLLVVGIDWVLFRAGAMGAVLGSIRDMSFLTLMGTHERELTELLCGGKFLLQFAVSILFCTPLFTGPHRELEEKSLSVINDVTAVAVLVLVVCEMMASGYDSFIYLRF